MPDFSLNGYTIESQRVYDVLNKYQDVSEASLKKLDKNNDKIISEDELVDVMLEDDEALDDGDSTSGIDDEEDAEARRFRKQMNYYQDQNRRLQERVCDLTAKLGKCKKAGDTDSIVSQIQQVQTQIDSNCNQIYQLLVNKELSDEAKAEANGGTSSSSGSSAGESAAAANGANAGTSYTADGKIGNTPSKAANVGIQYDGASASEMKSIMQKAGCNFHDGAWCADFVTFATKQASKGSNTPHNFAETCPNTASCGTISKWARDNGLYTTDIKQVKPGDFILYGSIGSERHIGIVTAVNADGSVDTIEGNTSDDNGRYTNGVVNQHHGVKSYSGFVLMH